ncbi:hypothetical protein [Pseudomonas fragariae (ex Marin et al. 2024)]|uniref:hypothetical protein n=1 Tax=Pseudomonas fragariae (ex Marin et al. 2024) TaxID=3080056 RepID=UPI003F79122F
MKLERSMLITLAAHESSIQRIKALTAEIGLHLGQCENRIDLIGPKPTNPFPELGDMPWPNGSEEHWQILYDEKNRRKTHMWEAFREFSDEEDRGLNDAEVSAYLLDRGCVHCTRAWYFVRERKKLRRDLGIFRRSLRALGKSAIKALEPKP